MTDVKICMYELKDIIYIYKKQILYIYEWLKIEAHEKRMNVNGLHIFHQTQKISYFFYKK